MRRSIVCVSSLACTSLLVHAQSGPRQKAAAPAATAVKAATVAVTPAMLKGISARAIGPAIMGGRTSGIALDPSRPWTLSYGKISQTQTVGVSAAEGIETR